MNTRLRQRLSSGETLLGTLVGMPSPEVVEVLAASGYDWLFLDGEHGGVEPAALPGLLRAAGECPFAVGSDALLLGSAARESLARLRGG